MKGGHNRLPRGVKAARGTLQKCRDNPSAPKPSTCKVPEAPRSMTKIQREVWAELASQVDELGVFAGSSLTSFRLMVETVAETRSFDPRDPATARVRTRQVASSLLARFGLDPASRDRVSAPGTAEDHAEGFLFDGLKAIPGGKSGGGHG